MPADKSIAKHHFTFCTSLFTFCFECFFTKEKTRIATVCIGYADGYSRGLSNIGRVLINGEYAPVIGRVCMDQLMVDVTNLANVKVGDEVTVLGKDGENEITAEELATLTNTINYEVVCQFQKRVTILQYKNGKRV
jgi:alanine racemase